MTRITKAIRYQFQTVDSIPCLVVFSRDEAGIEFATAIPVAAFKAIVSDPGTARSPAAGQYFPATVRDAQTWNVGTMPSETGELIALIADRGTVHESGFALTPEHALELSAQLRDEAGRASNVIPRKN